MILASIVIFCFVNSKFFLVSFEDQNFCEGSEMHLSCKQNKRLSIYSANYGRVANGHMIQCPSNLHFTDSQPVYDGKNFF